jgi:hypothetical protein
MSEENAQRYAQPSTTNLETHELLNAKEQTRYGRVKKMQATTFLP